MNKRRIPLPLITAICLVLIAAAPNELIKPKSPTTRPASPATQPVPPPLTHYMGREIAQTMHWAGAGWLTREEREKEEEGGRILKRGLGIYERLLELALRHTRWVLVVIATLLVIAYLIGAFVVYLVMACLGELAIAYPVSGAFHIYAARSIGPRVNRMSRCGSLSRRRTLV